VAIQTAEHDDLVSDINVTPLVDVMLVLLVVFIVTAPLLTNAVKVQLPQTAVTAPTDPKPAITLSVDSKGKIYVDKLEVQLSSIEGELKRRRVAQPDIAVNLSADESSNYGVVAKVMTSVARAGISKLSVLSIVE
jgi:biopolymer transport protein ExbD